MGHAILEIKNRIYPQVNPVLQQKSATAKNAVALSLCYLIHGFHCGDSHETNLITLFNLLFSDFVNPNCFHCRK